MNQSTNTAQWQKTGDQLWSRVQESKFVVIPWNNPWRRFALLASVPLITAAAGLTLKSRYPSIILAIFSVPPIIAALVFFIIGVRTGGLYSFVSEEGFGVGCDADRITIPYSLIEVPQNANPEKMNRNCIVLPVKAETTGVLIERKDRTASPWDGKPYKRGSVSVFMKEGSLCIKAIPNEILVQLCCAIYPLNKFLISKKTEPSNSVRA